MNKNREINALISYDRARQSLDPSSLMFSHEYVLIDNLTAKLLSVNKNSDYEFQLAEKVESFENDTIYRIKIKKAYFSDNTRISSTDVANTFKRAILYGSLHIPMRDIFAESEKLTDLKQDIEGVKVLSDDEIQFRLKKKTKEFLYYLTLADLGILHPELAKKEKIEKKDWIKVSGAYYLDGDSLIENIKFLFYSSDMPSKVNLKHYPDKGGVDDIKGYDIGSSNFFDKEDPKNQELPNNYEYLSDGYQSLCYLVLNPRKKLFSDRAQRSSFAKKLYKNFLTPNDNRSFKKSNQFFLPGSKGYLSDEVVSSSLDRMSDEELKFKTLTVFATKGTRKFTFNNLDKEISRATGINVDIKFADNLDDYHRRKELRDFDAYLVPTSMSYHVITESLNILFRAKKRFADNPSGKIIDLLGNYQEKLGNDIQIINEIGREIIEESEVVPLFFISTPDFFNSDRIDVSKYSTTESMMFWRLRVK